jgi:hypothetical protein
VLAAPVRIPAPSELTAVAELFPEALGVGYVTVAALAAKRDAGQILVAAAGDRVFGAVPPR